MNKLDPTPFDRFSIVAFAPAAIREEVDELRRQAPPSGVPILQAHVTVKGTFVQPIDLDAIAERIQACARAAAPFPVVAKDLRARRGEDTASVWLQVETTPAFFALHRALVAALVDQCVTIYGPERSGGLQPHLTLVQQIEPAQLDAALAVTRRFAPAYEFTPDEIALVARPADATWESLATFPFGAAT